MEEEKRNIAYIDGANLYSALKDLNWQLDYARFRVWLSDKYRVGRAYIFIGLVPKYKDLYQYLQESGFTLVFKEVTYDGKGKPKGNCDADLVLQAVRDAYEGTGGKAVIVSSDGDYAGLVKFLNERSKLEAILSPASEEKCSILLKRTGTKIAYLNDQKAILQLGLYEKAPDGDKTP